MRARRAHEEVPISRELDHHLAQLGQLGAGLVDVVARRRRDLEDRGQELRLHLALVLGRDGFEDRLDLAREVERVRVEEHQLLFDPDRERRACEGVFDHLEAASGRAMRPIMIACMEVKSLNAQKSLLDTLAPGKRTRLRRLLFEFGPGNGTLMLLPIDQGIEHGPRDFFPNPDSKDPEYQFKLAAEAGYSALACQIGMAEKYYPDYAGSVPLILKVNGKTDIPGSDNALSTCNASVEDAVRLGADAVGYTLYVGSPSQGQDLEQLRQVRQDCDRFGMPLVDLGLSARLGARREGRPDDLLRDRLRRAHGDGDGRRHREAQHAEDRPREGQAHPRPLQRDGRLAGGGGPPGRRVGRAARSSCSPAARGSTTRSSSSRPASS